MKDYGQPVQPIPNQRMRRTSTGLKVHTMPWPTPAAPKSNKDLRKAVFVSTGGAPSRQQFKGMIEAAPQASHHLCFDRDRAGRIYAITFALVHAGREFTSCTPEAELLVIQETGIKKQRHEIKLEPYDFDKIAGTLGIELIKPYLEEDIKFYMENSETDIWVRSI